MFIKNEEQFQKLVSDFEKMIEEVEGSYYSAKMVYQAINSVAHNMEFIEKAPKEWLHKMLELNGKASDILFKIEMERVKGW